MTDGSPDRTGERPTNLQLARTLKHVYRVDGTVEHLEAWLGNSPIMREQALQLHGDVQDLIAGRRESIVTMQSVALPVDEEER